MSFYLIIFSYLLYLLNIFFIIKSIFSKILLKNANIVFLTNMNNYFFIYYIYIQFNFKSILFKKLAKLHAYSKMEI